MYLLKNMQNQVGMDDSTLIMKLLKHGRGYRMVHILKRILNYLITKFLNQNLKVFLRRITKKHILPLKNQGEYGDLRRYQYGVICTIAERL